MFDKIKTQIENPALPASGFALDRVLHLDIDFHKLILTRGNSFIPLPDWISKKKAIINPKNEDQECFKWAVTRALNLVQKNAERISKELISQSTKYNWTGLEFPVAVNKIDRFEKNNSFKLRLMFWQFTITKKFIFVVDPKTLTENKSLIYC